MEVPAESAAMRAFTDAWSSPVAEVEDLNLWRTSSGPIGDGRVNVEAVRRGSELWCLLLLEEAVPSPGTRRRATSLRAKGAAPAPAYPLWDGDED
jgi:hypothetical protein